MIQRMRQMTLQHPSETINDYYEHVKTWEDDGEIPVALSVANGSTLEANQLRRISSTHQALVIDPVRVGDRLVSADGDTYSVDYAIPGRVYTQLSLSLIERMPE